MLDKELVAASTEPLILSLLSDGESYGYALIQEVKRLSGDKIEWTDGMLYPVLHRMEREGWIESRWGEAETGRKRKYYSLKADGKRALKAQREQWVTSPEFSSNCGRSNMFKLEQAIADWRRRMEAGGIQSKGILDELEGHLRDDIEAQVRSGLDEERAFALAARRLGPANALNHEFAKSTRAPLAPRRMFLRTFYCVCAAVAVLADAWTIISFDLGPAERVVAAGLLTVFAMYLFGLPFSWWWKRRALRLYLAGVMKVFGVLMNLWVLLALLTALGVVRLQIGIVAEMTLWSLCAAYGLTALACVLNQRRGGLGGSDGGLPAGMPGPRPIPPNRPPCPEMDIPLPPSAALSEEARRALEIAREEALGLGHDFIGTEHVLLGLLNTAGGALAQALQHNRVDSQAVRAEVRRLISDQPAHPANAALPFTPRARKALQFAVREAKASKRAPIGAEHILLGLCLEGSGIAAIALRNLGVRLERLRIGCQFP